MRLQYFMEILLKFGCFCSRKRFWNDHFGLPRHCLLGVGRIANWVHRTDSRLALSQWEMLLQSNAVSHWLGANLESAHSTCSLPYHDAACLFMLLHVLIPNQEHDLLCHDMGHIWAIHGLQIWQTISGIIISGWGQIIECQKRSWW